MKCPYHPDSPARISAPGTRDSRGGWIGWLEGCCGLPAWRCERSRLQPIEAQFCSLHGCARPPDHKVAHEVASAPGGPADVAPPGLVERTLELAPRSDGRSTPCLAGNVLVYLTEAGRLVAIDHGGTGTLFLASGVTTAALRLRGGEIIGAVASHAGTRYLAWDVRELRAALAAGANAVPHRPVAATGVHLLGLPGERTRLHQGAGLLRLVVEHDPVTDDHAELYEAATGTRPGDYLVRRVCNPLGPTTPHPDLRPVRLRQVPVPVPGGVFLIGAMRWFGRAIDGALLVPTVPGYVAHA